MAEGELDRLWAGWRSRYVNGDDDERLEAADDAGVGGSLFERILACGLSDAESYILWRGEHCFAILNAYPYTSGHMMVLPNRAVADLELLSPAESAELWAGVQHGVAAVKAAYRPDGVNVGINLGRAAGAGVPDHLHVHVVPRWFADTNFATSIANARLLPESLEDTWTRLSDAWPR